MDTIRAYGIDQAHARTCSAAYCARVGAAGIKALQLDPTTQTERVLATLEDITTSTNMMLHRHLPALFQFHRFMLCGALCLLMLHCIVAKPLSAGSECNNGSGNDTCADGLACMPETPGSEISVCKGIAITQ